MATKSIGSAFGKVVKNLKNFQFHAEADADKTEEKGNSMEVGKQENLPLDKKRGTSYSNEIHIKDAPTGDALYYPLQPSEHGKVGRGIIIVNQSFDDHEEQYRVGAKRDMENLQGIYDRLNIDYEDSSHFDLTVSEMWKCLNTFASNPVSANSIIFVAIATHSEQIGDINGRDNAVISLTHIFNLFYQNNDLLNIPKVFLIQASNYVREEGAESDAGPALIPNGLKSQPFTPATSISDTLIVHSTLESRNVENGSFFIQKLNDCIHNPKYNNMHLTELLTLCANSVLNKNYPSEQTTSCQSTLRKKLYFSNQNIQTDTHGDSHRPILAAESDGIGAHKSLPNPIVHPPEDIIAKPYTTVSVQSPIIKDIVGIDVASEQFISQPTKPITEEDPIPDKPVNPLTNQNINGQNSEIEVEIFPEPQEHSWRYPVHLSYSYEKDYSSHLSDTDEEEYPLSNLRVDQRLPSISNINWNRRFPSIGIFHRYQSLATLNPLQRNQWFSRSLSLGRIARTNSIDRFNNNPPQNTVNQAIIGANTNPVKDPKEERNTVAVVKIKDGCIIS